MSLCYVIRLSAPKGLNEWLVKNNRLAKTLRSTNAFEEPPVPVIPAVKLTPAAIIALQQKVIIIFRADVYEVQSPSRIGTRWVKQQRHRH